MIRTQQVLAFVLAIGYAAVPAAADPVADFYSGKTVQLAIGYAPGGGYDIYARTLARHMGRHIPGNPAIVVQNMPGAGSIKAANFLYNIAPKDGTAFGGFSRGAFLDPLLGRSEGVQYVPSKYGWLGSISNEVGVCAFRAESGIATWRDMQAKPYVIGSTGAGDSPSGSESESGIASIVRRLTVTSSPREPSPRVAPRVYTPFS